MATDHDAVRAAEHLEESAEELYEHAPAGYLSTLPGGLIVRVNATLLGWLGYDREDLVREKRLHDLLAPGARIYYETHYAPLLTMQGEVRAIAVELVRAGGTRLPVLLNSTLVRDDAGEPRVIRTTVFDASERRRYERELQRLRADAESRARAALALAHVHDGVVLLSADGLVELLNPAAASILGLVAEDAVGVALVDAVPGWSELSAPVRPGAPVVAALRQGDDERWLALACERASDGATVWSFRDITDDEALEQLRRDVVAIVSHELRTPLTGVLGAAQTLLARWDDLGDDVRRHLLDVVVDQGDRLRRLVDRILLTSRLDAGALAAPSSSAEAQAVLDAALSDLPEPERRRVVVAATTAARVPAAGDAAREVVANLLDNALKYSDGPVRVAAEAAAAHVRFTIEDEGPGIPPRERERVFEKFYRLDPEQMRGVGGAGLGLYIARRLTEQLGGTIALLPAERGTRIAVELPHVRPEPEVEER